MVIAYAVYLGKWLAEIDLHRRCPPLGDLGRVRQPYRKALVAVQVECAFYDDAVYPLHVFVSMYDAVGHLAV